MSIQQMIHIVGITNRFLCSTVYALIPLPFQNIFSLVTGTILHQDSIAYSDCSQYVFNKLCNILVLSFRTK